MKRLYFTPKKTPSDDFFLSNTHVFYRRVVQFKKTLLVWLINIWLERSFPSKFAKVGIVAFKFLRKNSACFEKFSGTEILLS